MKATRADRMTDAFRLIQTNRRSMLRKKFEKDLEARPWVEQDLLDFEREYDMLTERGAEVVRLLCEEIVLH